MSPMSRFAALRNGESVEFAKIPVVPVEEFRDAVLRAASAGRRVCALAALPSTKKGSAGLLAVLADDEEGRLYAVSSAPAERYLALTADLPQAHLFERELFESSGVIPLGHPWLKPVRGFADGASYFKMDGAEVHEVAVGPIHAGVIEPGHFRFQCHGETVHHLEIQLGYQHRGVEALLRGGPDARSLTIAESICGDTAVGHAWAHCALREGLADCVPSLRAEAIRAIGLECERAANHIGDLGALSNDIGFLPAMSWFGRMRGDYLNILLELTGNRVGKGLVRPGGVGFDLTPEMRTRMRELVERSAREVAEVGELFFGEPSVLGRLEETGVVTETACRDLGVVGPAARASGVDRDVRRDHAHGLYRFRHIPSLKLDSGDVYARAMMRWLETQRTLEFLKGAFARMAEGDIRVLCGAPEPGRLAVSLVEGWRGEICHVARTDARGRFDWYKVYDPSFHNWIALALALRGGEISDFPLCNKSFNLSYAGHDL